jgi:TctA family transporter
MLSEHLDIVFTLVWIVVIASIVTSGIGLLISPWLARMPTLKGNLVIPIVLCVCFLGAFATRGRLADVVVAALFGVLGYFMDKYRFSRANVVIGMVLATMIERSLHVSLTLYGGDFLLERPIALAMFVLIVLTTAWPFVRSRRRRSAPSIEGGRP